MKLKLLLIIICHLAFLSCEKNDSNDTFGYPNGVEVADMDSENDCSLAECSDERIVRLLANDVKGKIFKGVNDGRYGVSYPFTFDSFIHFIFCDLPMEFRIEGLQVEFSGEVVDACGVLQAAFPIEEIYLLKLTKIKKQ